MKSKTRNSKGSKRTSNGVSGRRKETVTQIESRQRIETTPSQDYSQPSEHSGHDQATGTSELIEEIANRIVPVSIAPQFSPQHSHYPPHTEGPNGMDSSADYASVDRKVPMTSMETEYIEALYSDLSKQVPQTHGIDIDELHDSAYSRHSDLRNNALKPLPGSNGSNDINYEGVESYEDEEDGDREDFDDDLDVYEHDDFLSSQEAILIELRREQVEFEENVRQLQRQLQRQGSLLPMSLGDSVGFENMVRDDLYPDSLNSVVSPTGGRHSTTLQTPGHDASSPITRLATTYPRSHHGCQLCSAPKPSLCLERYGWVWKPIIVEALATAAAAIASFHVQQQNSTQGRYGNGADAQHASRYGEFLPRLPSDTQQDHYSDSTLASNGSMSHFDSSATVKNHPELQSPQIRHIYRGATPPPLSMVYPLPLDAPYKFGRESSAFLEPVGEFHEFQSAEGNSRQVLLHVWPPSNLDAPLLQKLEACCREFQENDIPPFQTPLTLAAGGGSVLGSNTVTNGFTTHHQSPTLNLPNHRATGAQPHPNQRHQHHQSSHQQNQHQDQQHQQYQLHQHHHQHAPPCDQHQHQSCAVHGESSSPGKDLKMTPNGTVKSQSNVCQHGGDGHGRECTQHHGHSTRSPQDLTRESTTQSRLLRLIRAIQMVEKVIIARHLKYLFPTLYEKYHGLQFGTPRLFDAVATVAMALDVSPRLHHDKAHTKHGFCWIVACGDFIGGDLCIPELGKRVVMRPGTVVAIRSTVVAYYIERYAKNTSMYTMYAYTSDNNWPPAA
ncbi:hypothetical protein EDD11_007660 [Mortierella claussenii]|nr:hypothetical protein EDD11_007660 [Mortierella claussenii]